MNTPKRILAALFVTGMTLGAGASAEVVKIAFIDPFSGPFAPNGKNLIRSFQTVAEIARKENWAGGPTFEFVEFDNKASPQETLSQLKLAIDQGYRYVTQGAGSGAAMALVDAINKHNERNPGKEVVYLNNAAMDPDMTNSKCSFWHFRLEANSDMKLEALSSYIANDKTIKKVYIIGQNYATGQQISKSAKDYLKRKRPDIQIVGDDFHPIGQVKDFSPYIAKIKASGADSVITGNWGMDLALLIKAARDADLKATIFTLLGNSVGAPVAFGAAGADRVKLIASWTPNTEKFTGKEIVEAFAKKYDEDFFQISAYQGIALLSKGIKEAKSIEPLRVAYAMEGLKVASLNGEVEMRKADHQLQQTLYLMSWSQVNNKDVRYDQEKTGYGWKVVQRIDPYAAAQPTSCQMKRPAL
jgi:branched-chain amino acid transport system substrate-binding protein